MENILFSSEKIIETIKCERDKIIKLESRLGKSGVPNNRLEEFIKHQREEIIKLESRLGKSGVPNNRLEEGIISNSCKSEDVNTHKQWFVKKCDKLLTINEMLSTLIGKNLANHYLG